MKQLFPFTFGLRLMILLGAIGSFLYGQQASIDSLNQLAYQQYRVNVNEGKSLAYKALSLAEDAQLQAQIVDSYVNLGRCFRLTSQWDSAYMVLEKGIELGKEVGHTLGEMNATNNLGLAYMWQGKVEEAHPMFKRTLVLARSIDNWKGQANAFNNLFLIANEQEKYDSAFWFLDGAMAAYQKAEDSSGIARVFLNKAFIFDLLEENDSAIQYNFKALRIQESLNLSYQQASSYKQIGALYSEKGQDVDALELYLQALELYEEIGDKKELAAINNFVGFSLVALGSFEEALPYLEESLAYARETEDPYMIGNSLVSLGNWYVDQKKIDPLAEKLLKEAVDQLIEAETFNLASAYDGLGDLAMLQGNRGLAKDWYQKELETAEEFEELKGQVFALKNLVPIYEAEGNLRQALQTQKQYQLISDSLINVEALENDKRLTIKYESEKKERENLELQNSLTQSELEAAEQRALRNQLLGLAAIVLLLGVGGFIWYRYRQRIRHKEQEMALEQERARKEQQAKEAEKLRELDAMKTRFFTNISHEFRTPLTLILGQNEQLQSAIQDEKLQNRLEMVGRNGYRLLDLVNQVLDVAKLEAGGMELEQHRLDAIPFLKHMLFSFESMAMEKGIDLVFDSDLTELDTAFDLKKIERVLFNLLSNAIKFTPADGRIRMEVKELHRQLHISIADSGVGIKASQLPYIFDRFYQADSSENQPQPGTGIGLSLVKELVELHQGTIEVESKLNKGTTFLISLPIPANVDQFEAAMVQSQLNPEALPSKTIASEIETAPIAGKVEQILLVEDNPDVRAFVKEQILSFGYQVHEANDGVEGLQKAQEIIPDLIISDIMMPRLDGYGVAKGLKEDERTSHIPLILLTSKASDDSKISALELGIDDYLLKPFNAKELEVRIKNLIEQRKRLRERFSSATVIRPNEVSGVSMDQEFLKKVLESIETHMNDEQFGVEGLSEKVGLSVNHLNRKLGALIDQTAGKLIRSMRLQRAADLIQQKVGSISEIAYDTGFSSPANFTRSFKQQFGMSPSAYQKQFA